MIRKLKGIIDTIDNNWIIMDVGGVGYQVFCSASTMRNLAGTGQEAVLFIDTQVREDYINLYGFYTDAEHQAFNNLIKVNGVGNKMAIAILSNLSVEQLTIAISAKDKAAFRSVPGVGPKIAERIIIELKNKFVVNSNQTDQSPTISSSNNKANNDISDAISALISLGYSRSDAYSTINKISAQNDNITLDALIKAGLVELSSAR